MRSLWKQLRIRSYRVFLAYEAAESEFAEAQTDRLRGLGYKVFSYSLEGASSPSELKRELHRCDCVVALMSNGVGGSFVADELFSAQQLRKPFFAVEMPGHKPIIDSVWMLQSKASSLPNQLEFHADMGVRRRVALLTPYALLAIVILVSILAWPPKVVPAIESGFSSITYEYLMPEKEYTTSAVVVEASSGNDGSDDTLAQMMRGRGPIAQEHPNLGLRIMEAPRSTGELPDARFMLGLKPGSRQDLYSIVGFGYYIDEVEDAALDDGKATQVTWGLRFHSSHEVSASDFLQRRLICVNVDVFGCNRKRECWFQVRLDPDSVFAEGREGIRIYGGRCSHLGGNGQLWAIIRGTDFAPIGTYAPLAATLR